MRRSAALLAAALLAAAPAVARAATVTVVHGIPGFKADVYLDGTLRLHGFDAGAMTSPIRLAAGSYALAIRAAGSSSASRPVLTARLRLSGSESASVVAHLDARERPRLDVYRNDVSRLPAGRSRLVFRQTAAAPPVDVLVDGRPLLRGLRNAAQRAASVPAGTHRVAVARAGSTRPIWGPAPVSFRPGTVYLVYALGSARRGTLDQLVQRIGGRATPPARVATGTDGLAAGRAARAVRPAGALPERSAPPPRSRWRVHRARLRDQPHVRVHAPVTLRIPALGIAAPVRAYGVTGRRGELALPHDATTVAWYRYGPTPGAPGSAVLAAHVDYGGRRGVFFALGRLSPGDTVEITLAGGRQRRFVVVARRSYPKQRLPVATVFASGGRPLLTLVTCGGRFDARSRHYAANTVVYAVPQQRR